METTVKTEGQAHELRRNWILPLVGVLLIAVAGTDVIARLLPALAFLPFLLAPVGGSVALVTLWRNAYRLARPVRYRATPELLEISGRAPIRGPDIREIRLLPYPGRRGDTIVELVVGGRQLTLWMDRPAATSLVATLGRRRSTFGIVVPFYKRFVSALALVGVPLCLLSLASSRGRGEPLAWLMLAWSTLCGAFFVGWLAGLAKGRVVVGADGFTTAWLFWRRFVGYDEIASLAQVSSWLSPHSPSVLVARRPGRGKDVQLYPRDAPSTDGAEGGEGRALFEDLEAELRAWNASSRTNAVASHLARQGRSVREWLTSLDAAASGAPGYRRIAVSAEDLAEVTRSPDIAPELRAAAAAALVRTGAAASWEPSSSEPSATRARAPRDAVRVAAEASADPVTREVLLAVAEARTDAQFEAALGAAVRGSRSAPRT